ncbi:Hypothetical predicted protein [Octopus vulgaris]|uniref:Uncharacterized protein n=1 Tax=Octopus vulgaris TaxID=6645 RepID=A0AA36FFW9_OCTVU|nr:Hypothetical predicted protein [Octopus vulgaris]
MTYNSALVDIEDRVVSMEGEKLSKFSLPETHRNKIEICINISNICINISNINNRLSNHLHCGPFMRYK